LRMLAAAALAAGASAALLSTPAQAVKEYGGEFWWGCTYSWGSFCVEPHYQPHVDDLLTFDAQSAHEWDPRETENRYPAPPSEGVERCMAAAVWDGSQETPWVSAWKFVNDEPGEVPGYGMIGTCEPYYNIPVYQYVNWGGEG
jgi:hypothetical protein